MMRLGLHRSSQQSGRLHNSRRSNGRTPRALNRPPPFNPDVVHCIKGTNVEALPNANPGRGVSPNTVKTYVKGIMNKLVVSDRVQAAVEAVRRGG